MTREQGDGSIEIMAGMMDGLIHTRSIYNTQSLFAIQKLYLDFLCQ